MKQIACAIVMVAIMSVAGRAWAAPQGMRIDNAAPHPAQDAGLSLLAAATNVVYVPVRLAVTIVSGEIGGATAWLTGGTQSSAYAIWNATEGQAFITPAVFEGRERLRFGP